MAEKKNDADEDARMREAIQEALVLLESCKEFAQLIPEVRTNLVYARKYAQDPHDVLAIDGRITVVQGMPRAAGLPRFGASSHMARLLLELRKRDPSIRAGINFAYNPALVAWLEEYARQKGWIFSMIDRRNEPDACKDREGTSMPWKAGEAIRVAGGKVPKLFYETGAVGKEPVSVLVGTDPVTIVTEITHIARLFSGR